jgi:hypothetical protein
VRLRATVLVCGLLAVTLTDSLVTRLGARPTPALASTYVGACGIERWPVKTLADPAARLVNFHPRPTTVSALRRLRSTSTYARARGVERRTYRIRARLVEARHEADEDYHLVVGDLRRPAQAMIVEFPASACTKGAKSGPRRKMAMARAAFVRACGVPPSTSFDSLRGTATITGVGFFDFYHGQTGVAPNAIELHPVLSFSASRCAS